MFVNRLLYAILNLVINLICLILMVRIGLIFFGANTQTPFVTWVYSNSAPFLDPFKGIFPNAVFSDGYILEMPAVAALLVYMLLGYLILQVLDIFESFLIKFNRKTTIENA